MPLKVRTPDLKQVNDTHRPVIITQNGDPRAVLQDVESFESMRNAIGMLQLISLGEEAIQTGKVVDQDAVFATLEESLRREAK